jgi:hypothetical protein
MASPPGTKCRQRLPLQNSGNSRSAPPTANHSPSNPPPRPTCFPRLPPFRFSNRKTSRRLSLNARSSGVRPVAATAFTSAPKLRSNATVPSVPQHATIGHTPIRIRMYVFTPTGLSSACARSPLLGYVRQSTRKQLREKTPQKSHSQVPVWKINQPPKATTIAAINIQLKNLTSKTPLLCAYKFRQPRESRQTRRDSRLLSECTLPRPPHSSEKSRHHQARHELFGKLIPSPPSSGHGRRPPHSARTRRTNNGTPRP